MFAQNVVPVLPLAMVGWLESKCAGQTYHSVSAFGSSIGTAILCSVGAAMMCLLAQVVHAVYNNGNKKNRNKED